MNLVDYVSAKMLTQTILYHRFIFVICGVLHLLHKVTHLLSETKITVAVRVLCLKLDHSTICFCIY